MVATPVYKSHASARRAASPKPRAQSPIPGASPGLLSFFSPAKPKKAAKSPPKSVVKTPKAAPKAKKGALITKIKQSLTSITLLNWKDPTFLFLAPTFFSVLFITPDDSTKTLEFGLPSASMALDYILDAAVAVGVIEFAAFCYYARNAKGGLTKAQSLALHWHLWNGIIIYTMMDGLNGAFSEYGPFLPLMHERGYRNVDRRYRRHLIGKPPMGPSMYEVAVARTVNATEVLVYSWMSIMAAVGIATRAKWSKTIEIIVLTLACYGTIIFVLPDFFDGCLNMQPIGVKECSPAFTPYYAFYVYFGLGINIIWLCVPLGMLIVNVRRDFGFKGM